MKIFGHRGARGLAPENTLQSFQKALEHNVDQIELDVRLTRDRQLVLVHDRFLKDQAGNHVNVARHTLAELHQHKPDLTTLAEAITAINHQVPIVIEIKSGVPIKLLVACVQDFLDKGWELSDFEFCSFLRTPLIELRRAFPNATLIPNDEWSAIRACYRARRLDSRRISLNQRWLWVGFLRRMHQRGWLISSYTVNSPAQGKKWRPYLYAIYTDRPDLFTSPETSVVTITHTHAKQVS